MQNSEYIKTMKLAASSRMAARRDQRRELGFDLHEGMSKRAFNADSYGIKLTQEHRESRGSVSENGLQHSFL